MYMLNVFALLISGGLLAGVIAAVAAVVIAAVIALILVLSKKKSNNPEHSAAEQLLAQHNRMHSRHKELIDDYHNHRPLSEDDKKLIEERNFKRGADGEAQNPLESADGGRSVEKPDK